MLILLNRIGIFFVLVLKYKHSSLRESRTIKSEAVQHAFCIGVDHGDLSELKELLRTVGVSVVGELTQKRPHRDHHPDPNTYLGKGKVEELRNVVKRVGADVVVTNNELTPRQERNLEAALGVAVLDRTAIILDIFARHAYSAEGKLQVELAQLEYNLARMKGLWPHLERLGAGIGTRGPGETQIETDRRAARKQIALVKRRLEIMKKKRGLARSLRQENTRPGVALAGYTNAGKSSLLNALTGSEIPTSQRLFQTLDPTTRIFKQNGNPWLVTDTVGFISELPHELIEAFQATLEETIFSDLIVHVVDASVSHKELIDKIRTVEVVLSEIQATTQPRLLVFNKVDLLELQNRYTLTEAYPEAVFVSAAENEGLDELCERIKLLLNPHTVDVEFLIPYSSSGVIGQIYLTGVDVMREDSSEGIYIRANIPMVLAKRLQRYSVNNI